MKKIYLTVAVLLAAMQLSHAQWTTNSPTNTITSTTNKVGIGTSTPASALDVAGAVHVIGGAYADPGIGGAFWLGGAPDYSNNYAGYTMSFNTGDNNARTPRMYINSFGHVGIGTTTPNAFLSLGSYMTRGKFALYDSGNYQWGFGLSYQQFEQYFTNDDINNHFSWGSVSYDGHGTFTELMRLNGAGNLGIGTTTPSAKLTVNGTLMSGGAAANLDPAAVGSISFLANSSNMLTGTNRTASEGEADFISNQGAGLYGGFAFYNYDNSGNETQLMRIRGNGNVGIGLLYPDEKLTVAGTIHTKEVKVDISGFPDYVFQPAYHLPALAEVKTYIDQNHHLPEMPTAVEVEKDGLKLGEMNKLLTKKVEELTLYLIEQNKQLSEQQKVNESLQDQINNLTKKLIKQ